MHQTVEQNSRRTAPVPEPEDPGSSTGSATHQLCYLGRSLTLSAPWRPRLSRELISRRESSASGGCVEIRGDAWDVARGAASAALLNPSGPPSTPGGGEKTHTGRRQCPV